MTWDIAVGLLSPPACAGGFWLVFRAAGRRYPFFLAWTCSAFGGAVGYQAHGGSREALGCAVSGIVALLAWWWRTGQRKRVTGLLGAKSRALRDALVRKARDAARPRPVLRPVPGGAAG